MPVSRAQLFETAIGHAQTVINTLDPSGFHPEIAPAVASLHTINQQVFLPKIVNNVIEVPSWMEDEDGVALVPILPDDPQAFTLGPSFMGITPTRRKAMAEIAGESEDWVAGWLDVHLSMVPEHKRWVDMDLSDPTAAAFTASHSVARFPQSGQELHYRSRPVIFFTAAAGLQPLVQGITTVHEYIHDYDLQRDPLGRTDEEERADNEGRELRAYHVGAIGALTAGNLLEGLDTPEADIYADLEGVRQRYCTPGRPFAPNKTISRYIDEQQILSV